MSNAATPVDSPPVEATEAAAKKVETTVDQVESTTSKAESTAKQATKDAKKKATKGAKDKDKDKVAPPAAPEARSAAEIKADIDAAQTRLASNVDDLSGRLSPDQLAEGAVARVKAVFVAEDGSPKVKPIAIVVGTVTSLIVLRRIFHR